MRTKYNVIVISDFPILIGDAISKYMNEGWYISGDLVASGGKVYQRMVKKERIY